MSWTIYKKNGEERLVTWQNNEATGSGIAVEGGAATPASRFVHPELEYHGEWMGECFVTLNVHCAVPIDFEIGDYIIYRGEKFVINYNPTVVKKARRGTYGEGFTYENVKFNALSYELSDIRMLDYVLGDNGVHYSGLPKFDFFCATIDDLADRLQVNSNRYCQDNGIPEGEWWGFVTSNTTKNGQRCRIDPNNYNSTLAANMADVYDKYFSGTPEEGKVNQNVNVNNQTVWDTMKNIKDVFGLNFIIRGRMVIIGAAGLPTEDIFGYGKGNGLYEIEKTAEDNQQIVTKLYAYGSDKNMPPRYYANLNAVYFMTVAGIEEHGNDHSQDNYLLSHTGVVENEGSMFKKKTSSGNGYLIETKIYLQGESPSVAIEVNLALNTNRSYHFSFPCVSIQEDLSVGDIVYFTKNVDGDKWPDGNKTYATDNLPAYMAVNNLMLPGFPNKSLYQWVIDQGWHITEQYGGRAVQEGVQYNNIGRAIWKPTPNGPQYEAYFSKDKSQPFIISTRFVELGIREATKYFDGSDGTDEIYPTIEGGGRNIIAGVDMIDDNGIYAEKEPPTFNIKFPDLGFDLSEKLTDEAAISMKDGYCGGRDFDIVKVSKTDDVIEINNVRYDLYNAEVKRSPASDLEGIYFPYNYGGTATSPYQIVAGDKFVLVGIEMDDAYISANSERLLNAALEFLEANDTTRYTFVPRVDEIFMARQHDNHGDERSYYETIKEGDVMRFADGDIIGNETQSVFIDNLTIKEYGNGQIPTYEVTLRNDKQVGTLQRIQEQVNNITSGVTYIGGNIDIQGTASKISSKYVPTSAWENIFWLYDANNNRLEINDDLTNLARIEARHDFNSIGGVSALGYSNGGGGGGADLNEPLSSINSAGLSAPTASETGKTVVWNGSAWEYGTAGGGGGGGGDTLVGALADMNGDLLNPANSGTYTLTFNKQTSKYTWSAAATGTVTSVGLSREDGSHLTVTASGNNPITTSGSFTIGVDSNYAIPSTSQISDWDEAVTIGLPTLNTDVNTLKGRFNSSGAALNAVEATRLSTVSKKVWGQTYWTSGGVPTNVTGNLSSVTGISMTGALTGATNVSTTKVTIGGFEITYDSQNHALMFDGDIYATGGVSALGQSSGGSGSVLFLRDLQDVTYSGGTTPSDGQVLRYNTTAGKWYNSSLALGDLSNVQISSLSNGQALVYDSSTSKWKNQTIQTGGITAVTPTSLTSGMVVTYGAVNGNTLQLKTTSLSNMISGLNYSWWGQTLTSGSVYGDMTGVGHISMSNNKKVKIYDNAANSVSVLTIDASGNFVIGETVDTYNLNTYIRGNNFLFQSGGSNRTEKMRLDSSGCLWIKEATQGLRVGDGLLTWDSTNNALKVSKYDGTAAHFYAMGGVSALGFSAGSGGTDSATITTLTSTNATITTGTVTTLKTGTIQANSTSSSASINMNSHLKFAAGKNLTFQSTGSGIVFNNSHAINDMYIDNGYLYIRYIGTGLYRVAVTSA